MLPNLTKFSPKYCYCTANKSVTSADLQRVGLVHHLQKSLNLRYYTADYNQIFTKMLLLVLMKEVSHQLTFKV